MKKVLVTGGAGFIGSHSVDLLLANEIPVRVLDNFSSGSRSNLPGDHSLLEIVEADITNAEQVNEAMQGVTHCLHLAAQVSVVSSLEDPSFSATQNILGFVNVLASAHRNRLQRLVYASSAAIYGEPTLIPLPEDIDRTPLSPYGLEKQINENYADMYHRLYDLSALGLRYFNVYGPRQDPKSPYAGVIAKFADCLCNNQGLSIFGDGQQSRDFIFVRDVAATNVKALQSDLYGACNVGTGVQTSLLKLVSSLESVIGNSAQISHTEAQAGDIRHSLADVNRMQHQLGISAETSVNQGLTELLNA